MRPIVAVVGMTGSGKSTVCERFRQAGWTSIRFGQLTIDRLIAEGREVTQEAEREVRERLRSNPLMRALIRYA